MTMATSRSLAAPPREACPMERGRSINVGQTERLASLLGGGLLAAYGLSRPNLGGLALTAVGGCLIYRGATGHCDLYSALNVNTSGCGLAASVPAGAGMRVEASTTINRPAGPLYLYWRNFENLPSFMPYLRSVEEVGGHYRWTAAAPLGMSVEWDAEIVNEKEGELIAWRSLPGSQVDIAGSVQFRPVDNGRSTEVRVEMKYNPPAGRMGAALAWLFGDDGERQVRESLHAFKQRMEGSRMAAAHGQPSGRRW
jgi:uncharacterized membrane protein